MRKKQQGRLRGHASGCVCIEVAGVFVSEAFAVDASMIRADANRKNGHNNGDRTLTASTPAVREYLATLDDAAFGAATPVAPKVISPDDRARA